MLKNLFADRSQKKETNKIVIVSGLPRSGTSMMMKMLVESGVPAVMDSLRQAGGATVNRADRVAAQASWNTLFDCMSLAVIFKRSLRQRE